MEQQNVNHENENKEADEQFVQQVNEQFVQETDEQFVQQTDEQFVQQAAAATTESRTVSDTELISLCKCLLSGSDSFEETRASKRKREILSNVLTTETYLRERRLPELMRFLTAKIMCNNPKNVCVYVEDLLNDCMIFRAGLGKAPVLFEERHLEAIMKSFDPSGRGWLTAGQVRRAYAVIGLVPKSNLENKTPTPQVLDLLREAQERKLLCLLCAGVQNVYLNECTELTTEH